MKFVFFYHSLVSDWNHGNAHFLRGVVSELLERGHAVDVYEPADSWSVENLIRNHGQRPLDEFHRVFPRLSSIRYSIETLDPDLALDGADAVIVHEWNEPALVARIGAHPAGSRRYRLFFHDTHHRAVTAPEEIARYDLRHFDGVLAYGAVIRDLYLERGWAANAWVWHEAADTRIFHPRPRMRDDGDLVWIGNWGDDERTAELREFLIEPARDLRLRATVHGVRYPDDAIETLTAAGLDFAGWLPNWRVPEAFSRFRLTIHIPRRPYAIALRGIPTIRPFEAMACGIPLVSAPWEDTEGLFRAGDDYLIARDGREMRKQIRAVLEDDELARTLAANGLETIRRKHTCSHRVDELLQVVEETAGRGQEAVTSSATSRHGLTTVLQTHASSAGSLSVRSGVPLKIAFYGSSLVSAYWNGAATYYRGIIRNLAALGHRITFYEPDAYQRQQHRDLLEDPEWARVVVYPGEGTDGVERALDEAKEYDVVVKASGVGVFDELLERSVLDLRRPHQTILFWDVDAPATLDRIANDPADPFRDLISRYDFILTYGGGDPVIERYTAFGARACIPVYNALDPQTHHPVSPKPEFHADLSFLGNRLPDRERRVEEFFLRVASSLPHRRFLLGGSGWADKPLPGSVRYLGHVFTADHNAFNCTPRAVLNISRDSMAANGWSPATRVFEAAGAAACLITDAWEGIELFLEPDKEVLVARDGLEVAAIVESLDETHARAIGEAAMKRVLAAHTYAHRAREVSEILLGSMAAPSARSSTRDEVPHSSRSESPRGTTVR